MTEELIGTVSDFFAKPVVAGIALHGAVRVGDNIKIKGHTTNLEFAITSMQINNTFVQEAAAGDSVGIKVPDRVRKGDAVYKVMD
jgi:selenocysteine-specific translation elongation factor